MPHNLATIRLLYRAMGPAGENFSFSDLSHNPLLPFDTNTNTIYEDK